MTAQAEELLADLEMSLAQASNLKRLAMLRRMTDLYLAGVGSYSAEQVAVFDAVIKRMTQGMAPKALAELSLKLATAEGAPADTVVALSTADDLNVSGPVLEKSPTLSEGHLVGIAKSKGQGHLLAIAGRSEIADTVTDVLVERGNTQVKRRVSANEGAHLSENSFARLISEARNDRNLAGNLRQRHDVPPELQPFLDTVPA